MPTLFPDPANPPIYLVWFFFFLNPEKHRTAHQWWPFYKFPSLGEKACLLLDICLTKNHQTKVGFQDATWTNSADKDVHFPSWIFLPLMIFWFCIDHGLMKRCAESPAFCLKRGLWKWENPEVYTAYTWTEHANLMTRTLHMGGKWSSKTEKLNCIQKTKHLLCLVKFTSLYPPPHTCFLTNITWLHSFLCKKKKRMF